MKILLIDLILRTAEPFAANVVIPWEEVHMYTKKIGKTFGGLLSNVKLYFKKKNTASSKLNLYNNHWSEIVTSDKVDQRKVNLLNYIRQNLYGSEPIGLFSKENLCAHPLWRTEFLKG